MFEHGVPFRLNGRVRRLVAPNAGVMTGPGTNTYLLGDDEVAVLDPGPALPEHIDAILDTAGDRIRWIVCTHTHPDHSPAWKAVAEATGAQVIGASPPDDMFQDTTFKPDLGATARLCAVDKRIYAARSPYTGPCGKSLLFLPGGGGDDVCR